MLFGLTSGFWSIRFDSVQFNPIQKHDYNPKKKQNLLLKEKKKLLPAQLRTTTKKHLLRAAHLVRTHTGGDQQPELSNVVKDTLVPSLSAVTLLAALVSEGVDDSPDRPDSTEDGSGHGVQRRGGNHEGEDDGEVLHVVGVRALGAVELVLLDVLLGVLVGDVGVGVWDVGGPTGAADNNGVPLTEETGEGHGSECVPVGVGGRLVECGGRCGVCELLFLTHAQE